MPRNGFGRWPVRPSFVSMLLDENVATMTELTPLIRTSIGFDELLSELTDTIEFATSGNYPSYNIERTGEDAYRITLAVAGFGPEDLSVSIEGTRLVVAGEKPPDGEGHYLYRGIASRWFRRWFNLADHVTVSRTALRDGLLEIDLIREVPDALKPKRIRIRAAPPPALEHESQAEGPALDDRRSTGPEVALVTTTLSGAQQEERR